MSIAAITKQLAKEAIEDQVQNLMGGTAAAEPASATAGSSEDGLALVLMGQLQAMQNALKDDQELVVRCAAGGESIRVLEVFAPSAKVLVLTGQDSQRALTRIITPADAVQLVCKPMPVASGAKPVRVRFVTPKPNAPKP